MYHFTTDVHLSAPHCLSGYKNILKSIIFKDKLKLKC